MNIGIDVRPAAEEPAGIGRLVSNLAKHLALIDGRNSYVLYARSPIDLGIENPRFRFVVRNFGSSTPGRLIWQLYLLFRALWIDRLDVLLTAAGLVPAVVTRDRCVLIVADLSHIFLSRHHAWKSKMSGALLLRRAMRRAHHIIAISEHTRKDILAFGRGSIPEHKVTTAYISCDDRFRTRLDPTETERVRQKYRLHNDYCLSVGTIEPRKNHVRLIRAFELIAPQHELIDLVIAGRKGWMWKDAIDALEQSAYRFRIHMLDFVEEQDLPALYSGATVFVYPSLFEGFGIPPLEAMAMGIPVITSSSSSLPEVVGDAAVCVDPNNVEQLAQAMARVLDDADLRRRLSKAGEEQAAKFSWISFAQSVLEHLAKTE